MSKRIIAVLIALMVLQSAVGPGAAAQSGNACTTEYQFFCGDQLLPGTLSCEVEGPCLAVCTIRTPGCVPPNAAMETDLGPRCPACGHTINLASGNTYIVQTDLAVPGAGGGLSLTRIWNSRWPSSQSGTEDGLFGRNWRSNYEERIFVGSDGTVKYARGDGSFWSFGYDLGTRTYQVAAPATAHATLVTGPSYWTLTFKNGEKRLFDNTSGSLISIADRNSNTSQLSYDAANRLVTVTDAASRHLYFTYASGSSYLVTSVTSDIGISSAYSYDSQGRVTQVTKPDGTTLSFEYNAQSLITAVRDSDGKILESHTYDSTGRGLTSSRAGGVDAVTINYPQ